MKRHASPKRYWRASYRRLSSRTADCIPRFCSPICSRRTRRSRVNQNRFVATVEVPSSDRREIERGLRDGQILGVVTTNALELGIDIGSLDACVMAGYAGSIASTWQRAGRAGRRSGSSCAVFVASSAPLDQFIVQHPDYFFGSSPEHAHIQPDNLEILVNHWKSAALNCRFRLKSNSAMSICLTYASGLPKRGFCIRAAGAGTGCSRRIRQTLSACDQ